MVMIRFVGSCLGLRTRVGLENRTAQKLGGFSFPCPLVSPPALRVACITSIPELADMIRRRELRLADFSHRLSGELIRLNAVGQMDHTNRNIRPELGGNPGSGAVQRYHHPA